MKWPLANAVVVRKVYNTHKDSTFAMLKWAVRRYHAEELWDFKIAPLEAVYKPTGQVILFRGFDDVYKLTSLTVAVGVFCWSWLEEVFEIESEQDFNVLDETIRGEVPEGYFKQLTLTYNPWVSTHWTKERFWDRECPDAFTLTTTYRDNEWLDDGDRKLIEGLKETNPERYKVVGLGEYGLPGGAYFEEFRRDIHVVKAFEIPAHWRRYISLDYGLDMLAAVWVAVDTEHNAWVYKELYKPGLIVSEAAEELRWVNGTDVVEVKYAPPDLKNRQKDSGKSIFDLFSDAGEQLTESSNRRVDGWMAVKEWLKVRDTRDLETGEALKVPKMHVVENCKNLIRCLQAIAKDERDPNDCATEPHEVTHITDALRGFCVMRQCAADVPVEARVYDERTFEHAPVLGDHEYGEMDQSYVNY